MYTNNDIVLIGPKDTFLKGTKAHTAESYPNHLFLSHYSCFTAPSHKKEVVSPPSVVTAYQNMPPQQGSVGGLFRSNKKFTVYEALMGVMLFKY